MTTITFTSGSGNWTCPAGVTSVTIANIGAGGGGSGNDDPADANSGSGGGGGESASQASVGVTPFGSYAYAVGAAGAAGAAAGGNGGAGGNSTFTGDSVTVTAHGGGGGIDQGAGGAGGTGSSNTTHFNGGAGGTGTGSGGGGGGSSGGTASAGNNGAVTAGGAAVTGGGAGGAGGAAGGNNPGTAGTAPGGAGGGGNWHTASEAGGAGANGQVSITYTNVAIALTAPNLALAAPLLTPGGGGTVALTTPSVALAAPLVTPVVAKTVALTTPNIALAAPLLTPSGGGTVALTTPNLALAAPLVTPPAPVLPVFPNPAAQLGTRLELNAGGTWVNVTSDLDHGPMNIGRGHPDESTTVAPATFAATLTNTAARYSPDNVMSDLWPWCVQNMPGRASIPAASNYLRLEAGGSGCGVAADNAALHVTGSLEVRLALRLSDWQGCFLAGRLDSTSTGAWFLILRGDGTLRFGWWDSGGTEWQSPSDAPLPYVSGDFAIRVTMDASTGTLSYYTAPSIDGTYTLLGDALAVTGGAATSVRAGSDPLRCGWSPAGFSDIGSGAAVQMYGRAYEVRLYSGIGGTVVADGLFSAQAAGATSWTGTDGLSWSVSGGAEVSDRDYRLHFESSEWPQEEPEYNADALNNTSVPVDVLVPLVGGGLLRRLSQRATDVQSPMYRAILAQSGSLAPVAYWPMEDAAGSSSFGSAVGGTAMGWSGGPPVLAKDTSFTCSAALPVLSGAQFGGPVSYTSGGGGTWTVRFLLNMPTLPGSLQTVMQVNVTGGVAGYVAMAVDSGANVWLSCLAPDGVTSVASFGPIAWTGGVSQPTWWSIEAQPSGSNVQYSVTSLTPGTSAGFSVPVTTSATGSAGYVNLVLPGSIGDFPDTVVGHVQVQSAWVSLFSLAGALDAHLAEPAGQRFARLCAENSIACRTRGNLADTTLMGVQPAGTLTTLLQAAADADQGVWTELRQVLGWGYVARKALYNQAATAVLSYLLDHLSMWTAPPTRDDQVIVNDVTYSNASGSSYRMFAAPGQAITGGRMSTAAPGSGGVGTYAQSYSASLASDSQLPDMCGWKLHIGTVDQARLPGIVIDLANTDAAAVYNAVVAMDLGDRLVISNPPRRLGFEPVTQVCQAITETLGYGTLTIAVAGVPELPYEVVQLDSGMHLAPPNAVLSTGVNTTATSWSVAADASDSTALFSTAGGDYPQNWVVDGERVTVTAMSGASSPQTATVTRSANGVVKSHLANAVIGAWPPPAIGL